MRLETFKHLPQKLIGKMRVKIMGRKSKREKRLARKLAAEKGLIKVDLPKSNSATSASATVGTGTKTVYSAPYKANTWEHMISDHSHYPTLVCNLGELNLWGATKSEIILQDMKYIDLVVNCSQTMLTIGKTAPQITGNKAFDRLNNHVRRVNEVMLDWSDGSDLPVTLDFWLDFYKICIEQKYRNILFCCMGGHGRTGTGIGCLVLANSPYEFNMSEKIVDLVREKYCQNAIETLIQENYLEDLEREKRDRTDINPVNVQWHDYKPHIRRDNKYTTWQRNNGLGAKTLTEVIAEAKAAQDNKQKDIFDGKGDSSALAMTSMEESQAANKAIVIDMLTKEERAKKDSEARQETLQAIEDYEAEQVELQKVKEKSAKNDLQGEYECFCTEAYECLSCEYLRINGGETNDLQ